MASLDSVAPDFIRKRSSPLATGERVFHSYAWCPGRGLMVGMSIADEKYVAFTTFRRTGEGVSTPVWIAPMDGGRAGFTTGANSGKAKRLAHTADVTLQPCDQRGRVKTGSSVVQGSARIAMPGAPEFDEVLAAIKSKYGWVVTAISVAGKIASAVRRKRTGMVPDAVVVIEFAR